MLSLSVPTRLQLEESIFVCNTLESKRFLLTTVQLGQSASQVSGRQPAQPLVFYDEEEDGNALFSLNLLINLSTRRS